jgi:hypothetical protein
VPRSAKKVPFVVVVVSPAVSRLAFGLNLAAGVYLPDSGKHSSGAERPVFYQENTRARARSLARLVEGEGKGKEGKGWVGPEPCAFFFLAPGPAREGQKALGRGIRVSGTVFFARGCAPQERSREICISYESVSFKNRILGAVFKDHPLGSSAKAPSPIPHLF